MDWTLFEALLVGAGILLLFIVVYGACCFYEFIVRSIELRKKPIIIRPSKVEYFDYEKALYEYVMKD